MTKEEELLLRAEILLRCFVDGSKREYRYLLTEPFEAEAWLEDYEEWKQQKKVP